MTEPGFKPSLSNSKADALFAVPVVLNEGTEPRGSPRYFKGYVGEDGFKGMVNFVELTQYFRPACSSAILHTPTRSLCLLPPEPGEAFVTISATRAGRGQLCDSRGRSTCSPRTLPSEFPARATGL